PGAVAHVDQRPPNALETRDYGLLQADQVIPRPELAAVRVAGELQPDAQPLCFENGLGLMGEQHELTIGISPAYRTLEARSVVLKASGAVVVDARQIVAMRVFTDADALVAQHSNAER